MRNYNKTDVRLWLALWLALPAYFLYRLYFLHRHSHNPLDDWIVVRGLAPMITVTIPALYVEGIA